MNTTPVRPIHIGRSRLITCCRKRPEACFALQHLEHSWIATNCEQSVLHGFLFLWREGVRKECSDKRNGRSFADNSETARLYAAAGIQQAKRVTGNGRHRRRGVVAVQQIECE